MTFRKQEADNLVKTYTIFSEQYTVGDKNNKRSTKLKALEVGKSGKFMGMWQLFPLSSCLNSVYPDLGHRLPKLTLHRKILLRANLDSLDNQDKICRDVELYKDRYDTGKLDSKPLRSIDSMIQNNIDFLDDNDEDGFALDDSVMITLLQTVTE